MRHGRSIAAAAILVLLSGCMTSRVANDFYVHTVGRGISTSPGPIQGVVPLGPGDVLYFRRASDGPDSADLERIPLRRIGSQAACGATGENAGRMYDYERAFLSLVLDANRVGESETSAPDEIALWNCLVENLSVQTASGDEEGPLQLRVDTDGLLEGLGGDASARSGYRTGVQDLDPASRKLATVGFNEVTIANARWPERQWTLLEWDQSGVLTDRNDEQSRLLVLKFTPGGDRFYVAECFGMNPTHRIEVAQQDARPTRDLIPTETGFSGWFKTMYQGAALAQSDLDALMVSNVHSVELGTGDRCGVQ